MTAETAVVLPAVLLVFAVLLGGVAAGAAQVRCLDAAREAARGLARGDGEPTARGVAASVAPGSTLRVRRSGDRVVVGVRQRLRLGPLPGAITVSASAVALVETGAGAP